jgi:hypothetical protein
LSLRLSCSLSRPLSEPARSTLSRASVFSPSSTSICLSFFPYMLRVLMGHDRTPAYPHDQVASGAGLPTLPYILYNVPWPPPPPSAVRYCRGQCRPCGARIARRRGFSGFDSSPRRYTHCARVFDAPLRSILLYLRVCILGGERPCDLTPPSSCPPFRPTSHLSFCGAVYYCADGNHAFCAPITDCAHGD